jgi:hypothetical protein
VLHPAYGPYAEQQGLGRWAEVAERAGVTMHASIDFDELAAALNGRAGSERPDIGEPRFGDLDPEPLAALCDILARHTATPEATPALADDLLSDDRLEAWPVPPDDQLS